MTTTFNNKMLLCIIIVSVGFVSGIADQQHELDNEYYSSDYYYYVQAPITVIEQAWNAVDLLDEQCIDNGNPSFVAFEQAIEVITIAVQTVIDSQYLDATFGQGIAKATLIMDPEDVVEMVEDLLFDALFLLDSSLMQISVPFGDDFLQEVRTVLNNDNYTVKQLVSAFIDQTSVVDFVALALMQSSYWCNVDIKQL